MIRTFFVVLVTALFLIITTPIRLLFDRMIKDDKKRQTIYLRMVQGIFKVILLLSGTKVIVKGRENIPEDRPVLYVSNHRGFFDIVVGYCQVKGLCGFIAKKELGKVPLLASYMKALNCLLLDRNNTREGLKTILEAIDVVKSGCSIWICPEGTRSQTDDLLPFQEGSMKIATKSGCPIIPVAITGTDDVLENHFPFIKSTQVTMEFGTPIFMEELSGEEKKRLGAFTRDKVKEMLEDSKC
jgi:1-acyl-sn-glycerol-3-phosphate acyltransferase